jgi:hypothetical protein
MLHTGLYAKTILYVCIPHCSAANLWPQRCPIATILLSMQRLDILDSRNVKCMCTAYSIDKRKVDPDGEIDIFCYVARTTDTQ